MSNGTWETGLNVTRALGTAADQVQITGGNSGFGAFGAPIFVNLGGVSSPITWGTGGFSPSILQLNAPTSNNTIDFQNPVDFAGITRSVFVGANVATLSGALTDAAATLGGITKVGSGTLVLSSTANTYDGATTVSAGTLQVATSNNLGSSTNIIALNGTATLQATGTLASGGRNVLVAGTTTGVTIDTNSNAVTVANIDGTGAFTKASTGTLLANHVRAGALTVSGGTLQIAADGTSAATSVVTGLTADTGKLDLNNNKLVVVAGNVGTWTGSAYDGITGRVASGRNNGTWDGNGVLTSQSNALLAQNYLTSLAVAKASDAKGLTAGQTATFGGQTVTDADVLVGYTYTGDANLSGSINADDYFQIDSNYNKSGTNFGWFNGDFNYDGVINGDDYAMIDSAFAAQGTPFSSGAPAGVSAVPEPAGALGALLICQVALAGRRRKPAR
jgi:autotransporter-associated beta strand protein